MAKHILKILRCSRLKISKVCLAIFNILTESVIIIYREYQATVLFHIIEGDIVYLCCTFFFQVAMVIGVR